LWSRFADYFKDHPGLPGFRNFDTYILNFDFRNMVFSFSWKLGQQEF